MEQKRRKIEKWKVENWKRKEEKLHNEKMRRGPYSFFFFFFFFNFIRKWQNGECNVRNFFTVFSV